MKRATKRRLVRLRRRAGEPWFLALGAALTVVDVLLTVIPADLLMIATVLAFRARGRGWGIVAVVYALSSALGALVLAAAVARWGEGALATLGLGEELLASSTYARAAGWMREWGGTAVAFGGLGVVPLTVTVIAAGLSGVDPLSVAVWALVGRGVKHAAICWATAAGARVAEQKLAP